MKIKRFSQVFSVCKAVDFSGLDLDDEFLFIGKTDEEKSVVCTIDKVPQNITERDDGWNMMRIQGVLDFSLIGILSKLSTLFAQNKIGIFAVSTFNTDYIFVKSENYEKALKVLSEGGYEIV